LNIALTQEVKMTMLATAIKTNRTIRNTE
jgi:hypothetical protein